MTSNTSDTATNPIPRSPKHGKALLRALRSGDDERQSEALLSVPLDTLRQGMAALRDQARDAWRSQAYERADALYTEALSAVKDRLSPRTVAPLWSNRAMCRLRLERGQEASADASHAIVLRPEWAKAYYCKGMAAMQTEEPELAVACFTKALSLAPTNADVKRALARAEAQAHMHQQMLGQVQQVNAAQVHTDNDADPTRNATTEANAVPDSVQHMREPPSASFDPAVLLAQSLHPRSTWYTSSNMAQGIHTYLRQCDAAFHVPRSAVKAVQDPVWARAWQHAVAHSVAVSLEHGKGGPTVLAVGSLMGMLAVAAERAGAKRVHVVQPNALLAGYVTRVAQRNGCTALQPVWVRPVEEVVFGVDTHIGANVVLLPQLDASLLGARVLPAWKHVQRSLLARKATDPPVQVVPHRCILRARLVHWLDSESWQDIDLSVLHNYRWNLFPQPTALSQLNYRYLSDAFNVMDVTLDPKQPIKLSHRMEASITQVGVTASGIVGGFVLFWETQLTQHSDARVTTDPEQASALSKHLRHVLPCFQYCDPKPVFAGNTLTVRVHRSLTKTWLEPASGTTLTRTNLTPSWYVDMLHDDVRNRAYERSIGAAVDNLLLDSPLQRTTTLLDVGSGLGLLSMFAALRGAHCNTESNSSEVESDASRLCVVSVEAMPHLARTSQQLIQANAKQHPAAMESIRVLCKDMRSLEAADVPDPVDAIVFEVFDCGLLGEGVLHLLPPLRKAFGAKACRLIPAKARVQGMFVEYRMNSVSSVDMSDTNPMLWHDEYTSVDVCALAEQLQNPALLAFAVDEGDAHEVIPRHNPDAVQVTKPTEPQGRPKAPEDAIFRGIFNTSKAESQATKPATATQRAGSTSDPVSKPKHAPRPSPPKRPDPYAVHGQQGQQRTFAQLSHAFTVFEFDFERDDASAAARSVDIPIVRDGVVGAVVFWFELDLDTETRITTSPFVAESQRATHWKQAMQMMPELHVKAGDRVPVNMSHNGSCISFAWDVPRVIAAPSIRVVTQPSRMDVQAVHALDRVRRTQEQIMEQISSDGAEYGRVREASVRMSIQAPLFNVSPEVASRFATAMFM